tara:strand:+ start:2818 stop:3300 length:483 start_codon:yes stop_codon:yes gene_type:complete
MDILTKKGQTSLHYEHIMLDKIREHICKKHKNNSFIYETDKDKPSKVDGFIVKDNVLSGIFESKCRNMGLMDLMEYGSWLITMDKIMDGKKLSEMLCVPFIGFLYLIKDDIIMYWKITDNNGEFLFDFDIKKTKTQRTINGGTAIRTNAYLPFKKGTELI